LKQGTLGGIVDSADSVSASIVLYNAAVSRVLELIGQLIDQGVKRVYIIDNSDLDFCALGSEELPDECEYIRSDRNLGYGRGHNVAIERAQRLFSYHIVCNPDIHLGRDTIRTLQRFMDSHTEVGLSMPKLLNVDGSIQHCCRRSPVLWDYASQILFPSIGASRRRRLEMRDQNYEAEMEVPCLSGCFIFARLSTLKAIGGFDPAYFLYFEDFDLSMRARRVGRNSYVPEAVVIHERQSAHRHSWKLKLMFVRSAWRYFNRWGYFASHQTSNSGVRREG
jgi:GT2 family glycosyltransferase